MKETDLPPKEVILYTVSDTYKDHVIDEALFNKSGHFAVKLEQQKNSKFPVHSNPDIIGFDDNWQFCFYMRLLGMVRFLF